MNVTVDGNLYKIARITGPSHNYLALEVDHDNRSDIVVEALVLDPSERPLVAADVVKSQVLDALAEFNATHETTYAVRRAQFVVSDTLQPADIYQRLATEVLQYVHDQRPHRSSDS